MLAEAQEAGQILDEEQLEFIADPRIAEIQVDQQIIPQNSAFLTEYLDAYDSDCDDISSAKVVLMANLSSCDPDVLSELNNSKQDFGKRFVTQQELSAAFWLKHSNYNPDTSVKSYTPIRIEAPSKLPKNERLLEHIICQDVVNIVMHADVKFDNVLHVPNTFLDDNIALDVMKMENDRLMELLVS
ncbi:hypothetical protein Tco_1491599 [Tanacetum coccineum]